jgi:hemolysin activation/secretion protein
MPTPSCTVVVSPVIPFNPAQANVFTITNLARLLLPNLLLACLLLPSISFAADPIGNDEVLRQQQREKALQQKLEQKPNVNLEQKPDVKLDTPVASETAERIPPNEAPCFTIKQIVLTGDAASQFTWAIKAADSVSANASYFGLNGKDDPAIGQCLGAAGINIAMKRIQNAIIARGFVTTRVLAAPQDLKTGTLTLTLIPGRIHAIRFAPDTSRRATSWNAVPATVGDILNLRDIEQALENFKRVPTADADIQITPAEADTRNVQSTEQNNGQDNAQTKSLLAGESDLVISWKQRTPPLRISLSADDAGTKSTGRYQGGITLSGDDLLMLNDLFYASFNHDLGGGNSNQYGTKGYNLHYSLPIGYWQLAANDSQSNYHQTIAGINQDFISSGESHNSSVRLSRVVWRDTTRKISLGAGAWLRTSNSFIDDTEIAIQRRRTAGWQLDASDREFIGKATLDVNLAYKRGTGAFDALRAPEEASGTGTSRMKLWSADAQLNVPFTLANQRLRYNLSTRAQWNDTPLVPQDRFAIAGRYTVRGFDGEQILSAERGFLVRNDLGWTPSDWNQEFYLGVDYGEVAGLSADLLLGKQLAGVVIGLRGGYKIISYDVFIGQPISKPDGFRTAPTTAGFNLNLSY